MSARITTLIAATALVASCKDSAPRDHATPAAAHAPTMSAATQLDLARELDAAEASGDPAQLAALRARWQGVRVRWTVTRQVALCSKADACHVVPFPLPRPPAVAGHGWLPALGFAPGQFERIASGCGRAASCDLTFEGKLADLVVSAELPTSLRFADVVVVAASGHPG